MALQPISVLFVCLGTICRSTMAEAIFRSITSNPPYHELIRAADSCGTGAYHTGSSKVPLLSLSPWVQVPLLLRNSGVSSLPSQYWLPWIDGSECLGTTSIANIRCFVCACNLLLQMLSHLGLGPDSRTMSTLEDNGILDYKHAARKIHISDFQKFDFIFAMVWCYDLLLFCYKETRAQHLGVSPSLSEAASTHISYEYLGGD